eukprot:CAMPEP_0178418398 /NCGR_PEP_ID=MMETSP0689_2-20121128/25067_1 /TAXON_ID=160604 /ORGANISM="Amphidinium massartii, Strain CS-259" /LENGTH=467 /DNA_ID=CAMNT_0020039789 /DNA_START=11 /DNA_END=1414 /DNA_ORIENTATION=+
MKKNAAARVACAALVMLPMKALAEDFGKMLEVREMPYHLAERLEGMYSRYNARWFGGPTYVRTDAVFKSEAFSTYGNAKTPIFVGPFCTNAWNGPAGIWCFAQCDEEIVSSTKSIMLPCDLPYPDGTQCPSPSDSPPIEPSSPVVCEVLGHAAGWRTAGRNREVMPPASWWRMQGVDGGFIDAQVMPTGLFLAAPRVEIVVLPGERFAMRRDGTFRASARPSLCLGAEGGRLANNNGLVLWDCGRPPYEHEKFQPLTSQGSVLRLSKAPSLCAVAPGGDQLASMNAATGVTLRLGACNGKSGAGQPVRMYLSDDGTIRASQVPTLCLRGGSLDTPAVGDQLSMRPCHAALPQGEAAGSSQKKMPLPQRRTAALPEAADGEKDSKVMQMLVALSERLEQALEDSPRLDRLEQQLADLQASLSLAPAGDVHLTSEDIWAAEAMTDDITHVDEDGEGSGSCDASNSSACF